MKSSKQLNDQQLNDLSLLLNCGYSIKEIIALMDDNIFEIINERLKNGDLFEEVIFDYLNRSYKKYYHNFSLYMPFDKVIKMINQIAQQQKVIKEQLIKPIIYPVFVFLMAFVGLIIFYFYAFDLLIGFVSGLNLDLHNLYNLKIISGIVILCVIIIFVMIVVIILFVTQKKYIVLSYILINRYINIGILKKWLTYKFMLYYKVFLDNGLNTREILSLMGSFDDQLINFLAYHVRILLEKGHNMEDSIGHPYLDNYLQRYIKLANYSDNLIKIIGDYLHKIENEFLRFIKKVALITQLVSYSIIGFIIIFIYQIIMLPIKLIERI